LSELNPQTTLLLFSLFDGYMVSFERKESSMSTQRWSLLWSTNWISTQWIFNSKA